MGLVVKLQTTQQLTILVTLFKSEEYSHSSVGIELIYFFLSQLAISNLLLLLSISWQLSNLIIRCQRQISNFPFLNSLSLAVSERYVNPQQCVIVHLRCELIIIVWALMHELNNVWSHLSLARFFVTQQVIYKSKTEKPNDSLDIFVSNTSIARNLHLPRERTFKLQSTHTSFFGSDFSICVAQKQ